MKEKYFTFIIGLLIGSILTAGGFLIYNNINADTNTQSQGEFKGGGPNGNFSDGQMHSGKPDRNLNSNGLDSNSSNPQMPDGEKPDGEPPVKPGESTTSTDSSSNT